MPTQSSGPISFSDLNSALGTGTPVSFNQLYRGGTFVPNITPNNDIPTSGTINMQEMYSTWANKTLAFTITVGSIPVSRKGYYFGYGATTKGGSFGSISNRTFLTPNGPMSIDGLYYSTLSHAWHIHISSAAAPADTDLTFKNVNITGFFNGIRSARTTTQVAGTSRRWNWIVKSTSHPTSGTIACTLNYYG